jgi:nucleoid-associated protein YgaU
VTAAGTAARLSRAATLVALVDRVTLPPLRQLLSVTLTAGLATGLAGAGAAVAATPTTVTPGPAVTVTMHRLPPASAPGAVPPTTTTTTTPSAPTTTTTTVAQSAPAPPATPDLAPPPPPAPSSASGRWTVRPGDCFWSIAADVLSRAWGRPAADAEIAPYWRRLVEANRAALVDASNPDLVFPGQVFTLPQP